jgi:hypothetical protein
MSGYGEPPALDLRAAAMAGQMAIRIAGDDDLAAVHELLNARVGWLAERGERQWQVWPFDEARIRRIMSRRGTFLVLRDGEPAGTITVSPEADPDFWTVTESLQPAWYISKMATGLDPGLRGLGEWMMRWVTSRAAAAGVEWVRLDAWRTNTDLQAKVYQARGWRHLRTMEVAGRNSGALFQRYALRDFDAEDFFSARPAGRRAGRRLALADGTAVDAFTGPSLVADPEPGVVVWSLEANTDAEAGALRLDRVYGVRLGSGKVVQCGDDMLEPVRQAALTG